MNITVQVIVSRLRHLEVMAGGCHSNSVQHHSSFSSSSQWIRIKTTVKMEEGGGELKLIDALEGFSRQSAEHHSGDGEEVDHTTLQAVFHKRLDALCSALIERHSTTSGGRRLSAKQVADKVAASNEFKHAKQQLLDECSMAVNQLLTRNESDSVEVASVGQSESIASSSEPTWLATSLSHSMVIPGTRDVRRIASTLTQRDADPETKATALRRLMQMPAVTLGQSDEFVLVTKNLPHLLREQTTANGSLILLAKMFNASSPIVATNIFSSTIDLLRQLSSEADNAFADVHLKVLRLWHRMLMACRSMWIRYPDSQIEEMINRTFDFLGSFELTSNYSVSNPSVVLAALDPTAEWFKSWLHSSTVRHKVINALNRNQISYGKELASLASEKVPKMRSAERHANAFHRYTKHEVQTLLIYYCINASLALFSFDDTRLNVFEDDGEKWMCNIVRRWLRENHGILSRATKISLIALSLKQTCSPFLLSSIVQEELLAAMKSVDSVQAGILKAIRQFFSSMPQNSLASIETTFPSDALLKFIKSILTDSEKPPETVEEAIILLHELSAIVSARKQLISMDFSSVINTAQEDKNRLQPLTARLLTDSGSFNDTYMSLLASDHLALIQRPLSITAQSVTIVMKQLLTFIEPRSQETEATKKAMEFLLEQQFLPCDCSPAISPIIATTFWQPMAFTSIANKEQFQSFILSPFGDNFTETPLPTVVATICILRVLAANLDFALFLKTDLKLPDIIKETLRSYFTSSNGDMIICRPSLAMAELWCRMCIAGPKERIRLDESSLAKFLDADSFAAYFRAEPSRFLIKQSVTSPDMPTELVPFLLDMLDSKQRPPLVAALLKFGRNLKSSSHHRVSREQNWNPIIEYGINMKLISDAELALKEATTCQHDICYRSESSNTTVDWLAASLFLLFDCQEKTTSDMLRKIASLPYAEAIWPYWSGASRFCQSLCASVWPIVEKLLLRQELLGVRFACDSSNVSLLNLLLLWSNQVYLNVLDWPEVCNYLTLSIIGGSTQQAIFFVAVLFHLKEDIVSRRFVGDLAMYLSSPKLEDFKLHSYIQFVKELGKDLERNSE